MNFGLKLAFTEFGESRIYVRVLLRALREKSPRPAVVNYNIHYNADRVGLAADESALSAEHEENN